MNRRHALVCAPLMPEFDRESGSRRVHDFIQYLLESGWNVSFVAEQAPNGQRYIRTLQQSGVAVYIGFDSRLEQLIGAASLDLAVLSFWHVAERVLPVVRRHSPGTPIVVDSVDLHFLRNSRGTFQARDASGPIKLLSERFASEMLREINVYGAADAVLTVSNKEANLINDLTNDSSLAHFVPDAEEVSGSAIPFAKRNGILFVGNFRHAPNVSAVEFLCNEIAPLIDQSLLAEHPISIVGNGLNETLCGFSRGLPHSKLVGWVPSLLPYLSQARVKVIPLLYGAGTKRKLLQALMIGTPTVSTTIGIEGLPLQDEEHVLVADAPLTFARAIERLLTDEATWQRLSSQGRSQIIGLHGREAAKQRLFDVISLVQRRPIKPAPSTWSTTSLDGQLAYATLRQRICETAQAVLPLAANVLVVSKGDEKLLAFDGRRASHFPQVADGTYAGHHPSTSAEAIAHLEGMRNKGNEYLLFPATSFWWLDHYVDFRIHLDRHYDRIREDESCVIFRLTRKVGDVEPARSLDPDEIERLRPVVPDLPSITGTNGNHSGKRILALGIYLANQANTADHVVANLAGSSLHQVTQKWVALWGKPPSEMVAGVTIRTEMRKVPKFELLNDLLGTEDLSGFDYVVLFDDDIVLPDRFLDRFLPLQDRLGFVIAQPARTSNSYIDLPIVEQQRGCLARQTRFVEIGPVVSFHRSVFDLVFPFDMTSPMGWGYENIWSYQLAQRGLKMGIIDAVPVDHSTRKPVTNYKWSEADAQRKKLFKKHTHFTYDECFRVLAAIPLGGRG